MASLRDELSEHEFGLGKNAVSFLTHGYGDFTSKFLLKNAPPLRQGGGAKPETGANITGLDRCFAGSGGKLIAQAA